MVEDANFNLQLSRERGVVVAVKVARSLVARSRYNCLRFAATNRTTEAEPELVGGGVSGAPGAPRPLREPKAGLI